MLLVLVNFGSPYIKLENIGDLNWDVAFGFALPYFLEQRLQFGEEVIFTYGPWGILMSPLTGSTYYIFALLFRVVMVVCIFLALSVLANHYRDRNSYVIWSGAIALVLLWFTGHLDSYFLIPVLLVAYQCWVVDIAADEHVSFSGHREEHLLWIALSILSGWVALVKFNFFVISTAAFLLIFVGDVKRRRWPVLPFVFATGILTAWFVAGQELINLPLWVWRCLDLSNGYADAMAKGFFIPYGGGWWWASTVQWC